VRIKLREEGQPCYWPNFKVHSIETGDKIALTYDVVADISEYGELIISVAVELSIYFQLKTAVMPFAIPTPDPLWAGVTLILRSIFCIFSRCRTGKERCARSFPI
jgi:hypothetical protein